MTPFAYRRVLAAFLLLLCMQQGVRASDIYGYLDERGVAHFASEKLDARYQLFFKGGQSFDTADGLGLGRALPGGGQLPPASQTLVALFEKSSAY